MKKPPSRSALVYMVRRDQRSWDIVKYVVENNVASIHEISRKLGIPYSSAWHRVRKLERMGVVKVEEGPQHSRLVSINPMSRKVLFSVYELFARSGGKKRRY